MLIGSIMEMITLHGSEVRLGSRPGRIVDCGVDCVVGSTMETIQAVLDSRLLRSIEAAARRTKLNRSALIREAVRAHLKNLDIRERELRDRKGYEASPVDSRELPSWEAEASWPEE